MKEIEEFIFSFEEENEEENKEMQKIKFDTIIL